MLIQVDKWEYFQNRPQDFFFSSIFQFSFIFLKIWNHCQKQRLVFWSFRSRSKQCVLVPGFPEAHGASWAPWDSEFLRHPLPKVLMLPGDTHGPGICVNFFSCSLRNTCHQRKLRQTKCLLLIFWIIKSTVEYLSYAVKSPLALGNLAKLMFWSISSFNLAFSVFLVRGKSEKIESIYFAESSGLRPQRQKKKFCYPSLSLGKKTLI